MTQVAITLPLELSSAVLREVRNHPTTCTLDKEEEHRRIGWLICAYDVIAHNRNNQGVFIPQDALSWLLGETGDFTDPNHGQPIPVGEKPDPYWWRTEFKKRAGLY